MIRSFFTWLALALLVIFASAQAVNACDEDLGDVQTFDAPQMIAYGYGGQQAALAPQFAPSACDVGVQQAPIVVRQQAPQVIYQQAPQRVIVQRAPVIVRQRAPVVYQQRSFIQRAPVFRAPGVGSGGGLGVGRKLRIKIKNSPGAQVGF